MNLDTSSILLILGTICFTNIRLVRSFLIPQPAGLSKQKIFDLARKRYHHEDDFNPNKLPMEGRVVVITGSAGGIGSEVCKIMFELGATVVALDRNTSGLDNLKNSICSDDVHDERFVTYTVNQEDLSSVAHVADKIKSKFLEVDVLVNNAGLGYPRELVPGSPEMVSAHGTDLACTVNYLSHFLLTEKLLSHLSRATSGGRVVHVTSTFHWKVDGSELLPGSDGSAPLFSRSKPEEQSPKHVERSYANTKLAQIWHSRSIQSSSSGSCSSVCACPTWAATGIAGENGRAFLEKYAFPVSNYGPGVTSTINAILRRNEELGDALNDGRSFVANSRIVEFMGGIDSWLTSELTAHVFGIRDILANILAVVLLIGQRYTYKDFIIQRTSPESFNNERARNKFYEWSLNEIKPWL